MTPAVEGRFDTRGLEVKALSATSQASNEEGNQNKDESGLEKDHDLSPHGQGVGLNEVLMEPGDSPEAFILRLENGPGGFLASKQGAVVTSPSQQERILILAT